MNESANVLPLLQRLAAAVDDECLEVIYVDDSKDNLTVDKVAEADAIHRSRTFEVRILHRQGEQRWGGLSGAVADGMRTARCSQIIVMDGDLQHPPELVPAMINAAEQADVVVASRYRKGGSAEGLDGGIRHLVSRGSTLLAKWFFPLRLRGVTDPMTGFFLINQAKLDRSRLRPKGFKILLEILATHPQLRKTEVPLQFAERVAGESHGTLKQGFEFFGQLVDLRFGMALRRVPKAVLFGAIGGGVFIVGMVLLYALVRMAHLPPLIANAVQLAVTFWLNYMLNRHITWRDRSVNRRAAAKFFISRAATTLLNYGMFAWLIKVRQPLTVLGHSFVAHANYLTANVATLLVIMALNYVISDHWAFAAPYSRRQQILNGSYQSHIGRWSLAGMAVLGAALGWTAYWWSPVTAPAAFLAVSSVALFVQAGIEVWRTIYSYREPGSVEKLKFPSPAQQPQQKFCIIVPARHEADTLAHTLQLLARQTHPDAAIIAVICDDDSSTLAVARTVASHNQRVQVIAYPLAPHTKPSKPLQLNYVLEQMADEDYTVVGIFDAEDTVHPELLLHIDAAFSDAAVDVVQGGVQLMNFDSSWYALHNVLEYYRWFNSAMVYNAEKQFMPLGGNTIFVRMRLLRQAGGWPVTLTEDCSLGVLLSTRFNAKTAVYYDARLATREETPGSLGSLFKQRVRWNQGFFHEWRAGTWLALPSLRQRLLACYVLINPLLLSVISAFMVLSLAAIVFLKVPVALAMLLYVPLLPVGLAMVMNGIFLHDFGQSFNRNVKFRHYLLLYVTQPFYQIVLNVAALWSVVRELRGETSWYKTAHSGLHRAAEPEPFDILQPAYAFAPAGESGDTLDSETVAGSYEDMYPGDRDAG